MRSLRLAKVGFTAFFAGGSALLSLPNTAHAVYFDQICTEGTVVPMPLSTETGSFLFEHDLNAAGIGHNLNSVPIYLHANRRVGQVDLHFTNFQLETNYDKLLVTEHFYDTWEDHWFTGNLGAMTVSVEPDWDDHGVSLITATDYSVTSGGFGIDQATVQTCWPNFFIGYDELIPNRRDGGLLLGTNDTVYYAAMAPGAGKKLNVAMWSDVPGTDFDIYARCNAYPTPTSYDHVGYSGNSQEFLSLDNSKCGPGGVWYFAVNSYSGKGMFHVATGVSYQSQELTINVTTEQTESAATIDSIADTMLRGMRILYGMTEGGFLVNRINVCNKPASGSCPGTPTYIWKRSCTRSSAYAGVVSMCTDNWFDARVVAHEAGHAYLGLPDEYQDNAAGSSRAQCGHTMMSMITDWMNNLCKGGNHGDDGHWDAPPMSSSLSNNWSAITSSNKVPSENDKPWATDSYGFSNLDFNWYMWTSVTY